MIGARIGHIRVTGVLGHGGMGEVYRGADERLGRTVALKAIRADRRLSAEARGRFLREARTLSSLDHPNICRIYEYIEAEEGDFLVLELLEGVTLDVAIARGLSRARKLAIAIDIADALAAAHRKGIVHRDLKPENVMIAPDGTVKVLDFGIARQQEEEEPAAAAVERPIEEAETLIFTLHGVSNPASDAVNAPMTAAGIAVGTPAYMSPEQARGRIATPASDMYSFGLVLQLLFTEHEPHPMDLTASELMLRNASGVSEPMEGQSRDITTLIERLKSLAAADRPTALETLAVLRRITDAPRRRMRYAALAFVLTLIAIGAIKYVADITAARRDAERRRRQAEELVSFMVGDLRTKLEAVGRLDALDGAATRAVDYFASLDPSELSGDDLQKNALALAQVGEVRMDQGKLDAAARLFNESIRFASAAVARDPKRQEWQLALSNAEFWAGEAARRKGDRPRALRHLRRYLTISEQLAAAHPVSATYQAEVSYAHGNLGVMHEEAGEIDRALAEYRVAADLDRQRVAHEPRNAKWQNDLAISLNRYGALLQMTGALADSEKVFDEELALRRLLVAAAPHDAQRMGRLAVTLGYRGVLQQMMGNTANARASFQEELGLLTTLAALDPTNVSARRNRAVSEARLASLLRDDMPRALAMSGHAVAELREISTKDARPGWRRDLAVIMQRDAALRLAAGDSRAARDEVRQALAVLEPMAAADPRNPQNARTFCQALLTAADAEERIGAPAAARMYRMRAAALAANAQHDPWMTAWRAYALASLGRHDEAARLAAQLLAIGYRDGDIASLVKPPPRTAAAS